MSALPRSHAHRGLSLLVERAVWHAPSRTLWVADVHLGKAATYRALGQPAPTGTTRENLSRLTVLIEAKNAARLVFLGDLFHAPRSYAAISDLFLAWRNRHRDLAIVLVRGNHDLRAGDPSAEMRIETMSEPYANGMIEGRHVPLEESEALRETGATVLAGHIHPTIRLRGPGRDSMRFPCFVLQGRQVILPAFGEFTGGAAFNYGPMTGVCAITEAGLIVSDPRGARED
jgi:DNA ligase-associated metallophosphoesterase